MPKINAPTVAEHRARQRRAILDAARIVLVESGAGAVTPAAVGDRAGLARSSVYQYFSSTADLVATIVQEAFPATNEALAAAVASTSTPARRIDAYVTRTLELAGEGAFRPVTALRAAELPGPCREWLEQLLLDQRAPLFAAIADSGVAAPRLTARLVGGLLDAAIAEAEAGASVHATAQRTISLIRHGI